MTGTSHQQLVGFIWGVADLLRADYKQSEYGKVILPLTVLRRLDAVLAPTKASVLATKAADEGRYTNLEPVLRRSAEQPFFNDSPLDLRGLLADPANVAANLRTYVDSFWAGAADVPEKYGLRGADQPARRRGPALSGAPPLRRSASSGPRPWSADADHGCGGGRDRRDDGAGVA